MTVIGCMDCGSHRVIRSRGKWDYLRLLTGLRLWETVWCWNCKRPRYRIVWSQIAWMAVLFLAFINLDILVSGIKRVQPANTIEHREVERPQHVQRSVLAPSPPAPLSQVVAHQTEGDTYQPLQPPIEVIIPPKIDAVDEPDDTERSVPVEVLEAAVTRQEDRPDRNRVPRLNPTETAIRLSEKERHRVLQSIENWRTAWEAQNVTAYLAHYTHDFQPSNGQSHNVWRKDRKVKLERPKTVSVQIMELRVQRLDNQHWEAIFLQHYQSDRYEDLVSKKLVLIKLSDQYLIEKELVR